MPLKYQIVLMAFGLALLAGNRTIAQEGAPGSTAPKAPPAAAPKALPSTPKLEVTTEGGGGKAQPAMNIAGNFGEWVLVCANEKDGSGKKPCSLAQALVERESNRSSYSA